MKSFDIWRQKNGAKLFHKFYEKVLTGIKIGDTMGTSREGGQGTMTIREWICKNESRMMNERADKLEAMRAPEIMIVNCRKLAEELKAGIMKCGGDTELLDIEMEKFEVRKGKGGKPYINLNGFINYFPEARYGRFIKRA